MNTQIGIGIMQDRHNYPFIALVLNEKLYAEFSEKARRMFALKGMKANARIFEYDSYVDVSVELLSENKPFPDIEFSFINNVVPLVERIPFRGNVKKGPGYEAFKKSFSELNQIGIGMIKQGKNGVFMICHTSDVKIKSM